MMNLQFLADRIGPVACSGQIASFEITNITMHTSEVSAGSLFVALPSVWPGQPGGERFIDHALEQGACAVISLLPVPSDFPQDKCWLQVSNPHMALSQLAQAFYPGQPTHVMAVTGTNGKTSVTDFTFQLWKMAGYPSARLGTIGVEDSFGNPYTSTGYTSPNSTTLHHMLHELQKQGVDYLAIEASSHALVQHRLGQLQIELAAFTNLTHEHLDYHQDMENYFQAKALLFSWLLPTSGKAVINMDDPAASRIIQILADRKITAVTYGSANADITYHIKSRHQDGQTLQLKVLGTDYEVEFPLIGAFQVSNALCALANAILTGVDQAQAVSMLSQLKSVPGRLQRVGAQVFVDYAHTPDALFTVLRALRPHTKGQLKVVFGCGGNRDPLKRPVMGRVAAELADVVYVTDDNPRLEDPASIRREIMQACPGATEYDNRAVAINQAVEQLKDGDLLLIAGKGHETGQIIGEEVEPFNDVLIAEAALGK